ncbi:MAG: hypothetical protein ACI4KB_13875 [Oscillospiraceae bacterium]|nr:hypothetical protein [Oscillospiraceae bacterium]
MIKKDLNSDLGRKGVEEKYFFFLQLWHELLDQRTLDIYQYRLFNTYSSLNELISVIDKTFSGIFTTNHNIDACVDECAQIVKKDIILKKHNISLWRALVNHLNQKHGQKSEQLSLKFQATYAISILGESYIHWIFDEIKNDIDNGNNEDLVYHTQVLISQCIYNGWSTKSLYQCDRFFYNSFKPETSDERWEYFKNNLLSSERDFKIFVNIKNLSLQHSEILSDVLCLDVNTGASIVQKKFDTDKDKLKNLFERDKKYVEYQLKAKDIYSASNLAIKKISDKINTLSFYNIINAWDMHNINIIAVDVMSRHFKSLSCEDLFKTYDYIDSSGFVFENTINIIQDSRYKKIGDKLLGAFSYANISRASFFHEEKYMTLWIALESLSRTEMCSDIISNVKITVPAALSIRYLFRILRNFAEDMIRCNVDLNFSTTNFDIKNSSKSQLVKDIITIMKNDVLYYELENKCSCSCLLLHRIKEVRKIITDLDYLIQKYKNYYNHILWQIQRLYRIRNEIAHSASTENLSLTIYTEHLYDYLSTFISEIISCVSENNLTTLEEVFCKIQDNYSVFKEIADSRNKSQEDKDLINRTVCTTGILSFM